VKRRLTRTQHATVSSHSHRSANDVVRLSVERPPDRIPGTGLRHVADHQRQNPRPTPAVLDSPRQPGERRRLRRRHNLKDVAFALRFSARRAKRAQPRFQPRNTDRDAGPLSSTHQPRVTDRRSAIGAKIRG